MKIDFRLIVFVGFVVMAIGWHILSMIEDEPIYLVVGILWFITAILMDSK